MLERIDETLKLKLKRTNEKRKILQKCMIIAVSFFLLPSQFTLASLNVEKAGDILQFAIPLAGYASTFVWDDPHGRMQLYKSVAVDLLVVHGLKNLVDKKRPNGGSQSFPSGHTSIAFVGATFIQTQYGFKYAIPAYIAATFVGYSRVESDHHDVTDVVAAALIGMGITFYFNQSNTGFSISPFSDGATTGLSFSMGF